MREKRQQGKEERRRCATRCSPRFGEENRDVVVKKGSGNVAEEGEGLLPFFSTLGCEGGKTCPSTFVRMPGQREKERTRETERERGGEGGRCRCKDRRRERERVETQPRDSVTPLRASRRRAAASLCPASGRRSSPFQPSLFPLPRYIDWLFSLFVSVSPPLFLSRVFPFVLSVFFFFFFFFAFSLHTQ